MSDRYDESEMKRCAVCNDFYFRRKPNGSQIQMSRWIERSACGPRCAQVQRWQKIHLTQSMSEKRP